jgi:hypothetical protein
MEIKKKKKLGQFSKPAPKTATWWLLPYMGVSTLQEGVTRTEAMFSLALR